MGGGGAQGSEYNQTAALYSSKAAYSLPASKILAAAYALAAISLYFHLRPYPSPESSYPLASAFRCAAFAVGLLSFSLWPRGGLERHTVAIAFITLLSSTYLLPLFYDIGYWGREDWDQYASFSFIILDVMGKYGQLPLWNPYICGGTPLLAYPNSLVLDPLVLTGFVFGVVSGTKINLLLYCIIGWYGCFLYTSYMGFSPASRYLAGMVFVMSGTMAGGIIGPGHIFHIAIIYVPYILVYLDKSFTHIRYIVPCAISTSLLLMGAHPFLAVLALSLPAICSLTESLNRLLSGIRLKSWALSRVLRPILALLAVSLLTGLIFGFRLLPQLEYALAHTYPNTDWWSLFSYTPYGFIQGVTGSIGLVAAVLSVYGAAASPRRRALIPLLVFTILLTLISLNHNDPLRIWQTLSSMPILESLRPVNKAFGLITLALAIFSAAGLSKIESTRPRLAGAILVACAILLFTSNTQRLEGVFTLKPYAAESLPRAFTPLQIDGVYGGFSGGRMNSETLPYIAAGARAVNCYARSAGPAYALPITSPRYRGEAYLLQNAGNASVASFTPNRIEVSVDAKKAGTLVVNQNFEKNWKSEAGIAVGNHRGLISARVTPNERKVVFYYIPELFLYGASMTALGLAISLAAVLKYGLRVFSTAPDDNPLR